MSLDQLWLERQLAYMADRRAKDSASRERPATRWLLRLAGRRPRRLRGHLDTAGPGGVTGWVFDDSRPDTALKLDVVLAGEVVLSSVADIHRADLEAAGFGSGRHGFAIPLPREVLERAQVGGHAIVIRTATRHALTLGILDIGPGFLTPVRRRTGRAPARTTDETLETMPEEIAEALVPAARSLLARLVGTAG